MIKQETVERIFDEARIEEIVGEFVTLKKRGTNLLGLCPFHNEKTPSFMVSPAKGIYKCFGCGEGGNSVNFLMNHEHYTYPEALRWLAGRYQISIEEEEMSPEMAEEVSERESQYVVTAYAEQWFVEQLHNSDEGKSIGLSYFRERGFRDDIIEKFRLGYSPNKSTGFTDVAQENGYKLEYLKKTGLTKESERGLYDGWRGRVMFPIHNLSGRPIAFGGRTLKTDKKTPKYVNTPECDIYHKSKVLYGIYFAKKGIVKEDNCFLVEGYTDVISLHQAGIENVVASSGTSLTTEQIRLIKRYTPNITILYDGDPAGIKASFRGIDMVLEEGMNVKVVLFPEGEDPDSYAKNHSSTEVKEFVTDNAKDFIVFKTDLLTDDVGNDPIKRAEMIHDIVRSISLIPDHIQRSVYLRECSRLLEISEKALIAELNKEIRKKQQADERKAQRDQRRQGGSPQQSSGQYGQPHPDEPPPEAMYAEFMDDLAPATAPPQGNVIDHTDCSLQERDLVRILLTYGEQMITVEVPCEDEDKPEDLEMVEVPVATYICAELVQDDMELLNPIFNKAISEVSSALEREEFLAERHFINHPDEKMSRSAVDLLSSKYELHDWERSFIFVRGEDKKLNKAVTGSVLAYKSKRLAAMLQENLDSIKTAQDTGADVMQLLTFRKKLDEAKSALAAQRGIVILR